jgi:hypothetical protein
MFLYNTVINIYMYCYFSGRYDALCKGLVNISMTERKICPTCGQRPVAINYLKEGVAHYRTQCDVCIKQGKKLKPAPPGWRRSGYTKKPQCEKCGFKFKLVEQSAVFYVDGNLKNNNWANLKTVCLNCAQEVYKSKLPWKVSPLVPDF